MRSGEIRRGGYRILKILFRVYGSPRKVGHLHRPYQVQFEGRWREGKIKKKDLSSQVPIYFLLFLTGVNNDFILGRAYQSIVNKVYDDMGKIAKSNLDLKKTLARDKFLENNCKLIK